MGQDDESFGRAGFGAAADFIVGGTDAVLDEQAERVGEIRGYGGEVFRQVLKR
jgi:hypothetical protein